MMYTVQPSSTAWARVATQYLERRADLHPPLGEGENGPCYVVQRIRQEVRNPMLRQQLTQKVESGEALTNAEIYKVYSPHVERGFTPETEQLKLVPHAQYRMDMRKVRVPFLRLLFKLFMDWLKAHPDVHAYYEKQWARGEEVSWKEPKTGLRFSVVKEAEGRFRVITMFYPNHPATTPPGLGRCSSEGYAMHRQAGTDEEDEEATRKQLARRHRVHKIMRTISRPSGWRHTDGEPEFDATDEEWTKEHTAKTPGGSLVVGVPHSKSLDDGSEESKYIQNSAIPEMVKAAEKAIKDEKKVVFLAEGQAYNYDLEVGEDYNEQHAIAKILHRKFKHNLHQDTWEDASVDVMQSKSPIWKRLTEVSGDDRNKAQAAVAVYLMAQGDPYPFLKTHAIIDAAVEKLIRKRFGVDLSKDGITEEAQQKFYRMSFPRDLGDPHNDISAIGEVYTAARQEAMINKIKKIEDDGGIALVAPGASHVWNLKAVLEHVKPEKKKATLQRLASRFLLRLAHENPQCRWDHVQQERSSCQLPKALLQKIKLEPLGELDGRQVWIVDANVVRNEVDIDFAEGGNPARYGYVPEHELWIENIPSASDIAETLLHEATEVRYMQQGLSYNDAHDKASQWEERIRGQHPKVLDHSDIVPHVQRWFERVTADALL